MLSSAQTANTARSPHLGSVAEVRARLTTLRELAGDRYDSLDITLTYGDPTVYDIDRDVDRHRTMLEEYRVMGITWVIVGGPGGPAPRTAEFAQGFAETYLGG